MLFRSIFGIVQIHFGKRDTFSQKWFYIMKHEKMCNGFEILKEFELSLIHISQVEHYTEFIRKNHEWEFAGIYADDGISGTNTKKREEFNRMIEDTMAGKIDICLLYTSRCV